MIRIPRWCGLFFGVLLAGQVAAADPYPSKAVNLMVPYPAGGLSDTIARIVSGPLAKELGQQVIVENLGGVSGGLAAQKVLRAPGDGYYLFQGSPNELILSPLANASVTFKSEDFRLVQMIGVAPLVIVARKDLPANTPDELIELARNSPKDKPLTFGSVGFGSFYHVLGDHLSNTIRVPMTHVPYKGGAPLMQDLGGGQLDFAILPLSQQQVALAAEGRVKLLGTLLDKRLETLKQLPSVNEGKLMKKFNFSIWTGYMVKKDTPEPVVQRLNKALTVVLADPSVRGQLLAQSLIVARPLSTVEASKSYETETAVYRAIAKSIRLQPQ